MRSIINFFRRLYRALGGRGGDVAHDPFASFEEWATDADRRAYRDL